MINAAPVLKEDKEQKIVTNAADKQSNEEEKDTESTRSKKMISNWLYNSSNENALNELKYINSMSIEINKELLSNQK